MTTPAPGPDPADHDTPSRALIDALNVRQWSPLPRHHHAGRSDETLVITLTRASGTLAGIPLDDFAEPRAGTLEQALRERGIEVRVDVGGPFVRGPRFTLTCPEAMRRLANLVWSQMPQEHQAAVELRAALCSIRRRPFLFRSLQLPRALDGQVEIGPLTVPQAIALQRTLGGPAFRYTDWRQLEALRRLVQSRVRRVMPGVAVTAAPGCGQHSCTDTVRIGPAPLDHIRALTDRLTTAPTRATQRGGAR
ncbi:hypothetical protein ABT354_19525 [Streptomyces sp. NPDC000594]|uniref:hypothetical protein n=1 Tax=Streptomyces sp. NPDC000594 TaxID=3154261 RepID=UPI00331B4A53